MYFYAKDAVIQFETHHQAGNQVPADGQRRGCPKKYAMGGSWGEVESWSSFRLACFDTVVLVAAT